MTRILLLALSFAACTAQAASREDELRELRSRIDSLSRELESREAARREARDALRESERAISDINRALAALEARARELRDQAARIAAERSSLRRSLAGRERSVERLLVARQAGGAPDALRVALSGDHPAAFGRTLHYLGHVSRAVAALLEEYRGNLAELERLARAAAERAERLQALEQASRADREELLRQRRARRRVLERVAVEIRGQRREIRVLRADEARLARLVEELGRVIARVEAVPEPGARSAPFSGLRGALRLPVRGELTGAFGAPRGASRTESKGVFIRAPQGRPVRAIARARVVFADWMRGFGNLMILDHGENYLSIYANNEALLKEVGENVTVGEPIAITGASGGNEETGLYFELRHLGRAFDPLRWVKLK